MKEDNWERPEIESLGNALDLVQGIGGANKEPGGNDGDFAPLQVS